MLNLVQHLGRIQTHLNSINVIIASNMKLIADLLVRSLVLLITTYLVPGFKIDSFLTALLVALVLGVLNVFIKPFITLFTLPLTILTLGLFTFVINALLLILASNFIKGFQIDSFITALLASIVISLVSAVLNTLIK